MWSCSIFEIQKWKCDHVCYKGHSQIPLGWLYVNCNSISNWHLIEDGIDIWQHWLSTVWWQTFSSVARFLVNKEFCSCQPNSSWEIFHAEFVLGHTYPLCFAFMSLLRPVIPVQFSDLTTVKKKKTWANRNRCDAVFTVSSFLSLQVESPATGDYKYFQLTYWANVKCWDGWAFLLVSFWKATLIPTSCWKSVLVVWQKNLIFPGELWPSTIVARSSYVILVTCFLYLSLINASQWVHACDCKCVCEGTHIFSRNMSSHAQPKCQFLKKYKGKRKSKTAAYFI